MTASEAETVMQVACGADGECIVCAEKMMLDLIRCWPEHEDTFRAVFVRRFE